jgi:hypothetical protein
MPSNLIEGFGEGARAQISSHQGDNSTSFGGSPLAANDFSSSGYQSQFNNILSQTTPQQYQQLTSHGSGNGVQQVFLIMLVILQKDRLIFLLISNSSYFDMKTN